MRRGWEAREEAKVSWRWTVCWKRGPRALMPIGGGGGHHPRPLQGPQGPAGSISDVCRGAGGWGQVSAQNTLAPGPSEA